MILRHQGEKGKRKSKIGRMGACSKKKGGALPFTRRGKEKRDSAAGPIGFRDIIGWESKVETRKEGERAKFSEE